MRTRIRSFDVLQFAVVLAALEAILGLVIGLIWWLVFAPIARSMPMSAAGFGAFAALGPFLIILAACFYGAIGFVGGLIVALIYNLVARWTGGIQMNLEMVSVGAVPPTSGTAITTT